MALTNLTNIGTTAALLQIQGRPTFNITPNTTGFVRTMQQLLIPPGWFYKITLAGSATINTVRVLPI
jgi:hypothetical protein